ncbi:MAG: hypothetical protein DI586_03860 [Micavibrio aeruginosavorus]|uniref:SGNH/GDSL hydrolase family protein n=1 Tax=Micavibrio aeruginosavorus TaxID=349221 RepID=A0A2W5FN33_9BACT|nr:MAG: hypothetical protein DI586_03860 [Micavibrio aeruginosavorus]
MIGNSYIFTNDMPSMLAHLLNNARSGVYQYKIDKITKGGAHLSDHIKSGAVDKALGETSYSRIFFQEYSTAAFYADETSESVATMKKIKNKILTRGGLPIVVSTWPRKAGHEFYSRKSKPGFAAVTNPAAMANRLHRFYSGQSTKLKIDFLPLGEYWHYAMVNYPEIDLYQDDGSHPSLEGSYLYALLMYRKISGRLPMKDIWSPEGISRNEKNILIHIASRG